MLLKMERRRSGPHVSAVIDPGEGVHRILPQIAEFGRLLHRQTGGVFKRDLVQLHRTFDVKQNAAGVLANGLGLLFRQRNVAIDDFQRRLGDGPLFLTLERIHDRLQHVIGNLGGCAANQFQQRILKRVHTLPA